MLEALLLFPGMLSILARRTFFLLLWGEGCLLGEVVIEKFLEFLKADFSVSIHIYSSNDGKNLVGHQVDAVGTEEITQVMLVDTALVVGVDRAESRLDRVIRLPLQVAHQLLNSAERVYFCIKQIAEPRF
jgi:hypothetical protein